MEVIHTSLIIIILAYLYNYTFYFRMLHEFWDSLFIRVADYII